MPAAKAIPRIDPAKFRAARVAAKLSQIALAKQAKCRQATVSEIESGETTDPWLSTAIAIARAMGTTVEALLAD